MFLHVCLGQVGYPTSPTTSDVPETYIQVAKPHLSQLSRISDCCESDLCQCSRISECTVTDLTQSSRISDCLVSQVTPRCFVSSQGHCAPFIPLTSASPAQWMVICDQRTQTWQSDVRLLQHSELISHSALLHCILSRNPDC